MNIDLHPDQYWRTSQRDYELAMLIQHTLNTAKDEGHDLARAEDAARREDEKAADDSMKRLVERMGAFS